MKLPKAFILEKSLENKTKELLTQSNPKKVDTTFSDYKQIRYTTEGTNWVIEYEKIEYENSRDKFRWVLYDKDFYEQKWFGNQKLDERVESILRNRLTSLVELLNLGEEDYSIKEDNFKSILDRYATKVSESKESIKDKEHGKCNISLYEKGNLMIELKEFEKTNLGRVDVLD